jgi:hypothetical protein
MITASIGTNGILTLIPEADGLSEYALWQWYSGGRLIRISGQGVMKCSPINPKSIAFVDHDKDYPDVLHSARVIPGIKNNYGPVEPITEETPQPITKEPLTMPEDREALKADLDEMGVEYAPKARDKTLQKLWKESVALQDEGEDDVTEELNPDDPEEFEMPEEDDATVEETPTIMSLSALQDIARLYATDNGKANGDQRDERTKVLAGLLNKHKATRLSDVAEEDRAKLAAEIGAL